MSDYIYIEAELAVHSFLLGLVLMVSYDLLRLFRFFIPHHALAVDLEDLIYWVYCAILTFLLLFYENNGVLRGYVIAGVFGGMILYDQLVSKTMFKFLKKAKIWFTIKVRRFTIKTRKHKFRELETKEKGDSHGTESKSTHETKIKI